jgi:hypothetical protein
LVGLATLPAVAQDSQGDDAPVTITWDDANGTISVADELQTMAEIELTVGDKTYRLKVPVTIRIDTLAGFVDANLSVPVAEQVGIFQIEPISVQTLEGDYEKNYRTASPASADNVLVLYTANLTNLDEETVDPTYTSSLEAIGIDDTGKSYEEALRACDKIDPGETATCEFVFDVPGNVKLVDMKFEAKAVKQFSFPQSE